MTDVAKLGLEADSRPIRRATDELRGLSNQAKRTETATERMNRENQRMATGFMSSLSAVRALTAGMAGLVAVRSAQTFIEFEA